MANLVKRLANTIAAAQTKDQVWASLADSLVELFDASGTAIMLIDREEQHLHGKIGKPDDFWPEITKIAVSLDQDVDITQAAHTKAPVTIFNASEDPRTIKWLARQYQVKSLVFLPILTDREVVGVTVTIEARKYRHFPADELEKGKLLISKAVEAVSRLSEH
jgi:GAF domain-containing protein